MEAKARLPHALLLRGPEGTGKLDFAIFLARSLLCEAPARGGEACGNCQACGWFAAGNHPDFRLVQPEALEQKAEGEGAPEEKPPSRGIAVEQVRGLSNFIVLSPHRRGLKVILMHPAEALNVNAANALLKNLEEPPAGTLFLLVTHRPRYLPPTITSRCRQLVLSGPDPGVAVAWLRGQGAAEPELSLAQAGQAPLLALRLGDDGEYWTQREVLLKRIANREFDALEAVELVRDYPVERLLGWLQKWTFDLVFQRFLGRVRYNPDFAGAIGTLASGLDPVAVLRFHRELLRWQRVVHHPLNPRLFIEYLLLGYSVLVQPENACPAAG